MSDLIRTNPFDMIDISLEPANEDKRQADDTEPILKQPERSETPQPDLDIESAIEMALQQEPKDPDGLGDEEDEDHNDEIAENDNKNIPLIEKINTKDMFPGKKQHEEQR